MAFSFKTLAKAFQEDPVEKTIPTSDDEGMVVKFYPIKGRDLRRLQKVARNLARSVSSFLNSRQNYRDQGWKKEVITETSGARVEVEHSDPINPDLAQVRSGQAANAMDDLVKTLTNDEHMETVCQLVASSMRVKDEDYDDTVEDLLDSPISLLIPLVKGCLEANWKAFGELGKSLKQAMDTVQGTDEVEAMAKAMAEEEASRTSETSSSDSSIGSSNVESGSSTKDTIPSGSTT